MELMEAGVMEDVQPGYKRTEVGVIPEDWSVAELGHVTQKIGSGITPTGGSQVYKQQGRPFLRSQNVGWGRLILDDIVFIDEATHQTFPASEIKEGDVFLNITGASIGRSAIADARVVGGNVNQHVCIIRPESTALDPRFLCYYLNSQPGQRKIDSFQAGGNRQGLNYGQIGTFPIPLPKVAEQRLIASALSDADGLVAGLEAVVAKKRAIKQGALQALLTPPGQPGHRRLPGFSGGWGVKRLGEVLRFQVGFPFSSAYFNNEGTGIRLVKNRDLKADDQPIHYSGTYDKNFLVSNGDVLIGMDGDFLPCLWSKGTALLNQRVGRVVVSESLDKSFIYYYLIDPLKAIEAVTSSTTVKHLSHGDVEGIELPLPHKDEQTEIATVLTDMDAELRALEGQLAKLRGVKQGLIGVLLTGRKRLV